MCDAVSYSSWYPTASPVLATFFIYSKVPCSEYACTHEQLQIEQELAYRNHSSQIHHSQ